MDRLSSVMDFVNNHGSVSVIILITVVTGVLIWNKIKDLPPGPVLIPFVGSIPRLVGALTGEYGMELSRRYKSDIVSMRLAGQVVVFLNSYPLIKEHFMKGTDLVDRIDKNILQIADKNHGGLIMSSGPLWRHLRRFTLHMMRDFGMGKATADDIVCDETDKVIAHFAAARGEPIDPRSVINMAVSNVICQFVMGKRFKYDDKTFENVLDNLNKFVHTVSTPFNVMTLRTRLGRIIFHQTLEKIQGHFGVFVEFIEGEINEHREKWDGSVNDMIDGFLKEIDEGAADPDIFNDFQLRCLIVDLFAAGSETTHTTLRWLLLYMAAYPQIQERVYEELMEAVGTERHPNMSDKRHTPYTEAVINEVQRFNTIFQLGLFHTCREHDFQIGPYKLPRGTPVTANLRAVHRDPNFWKNPEQFDPENFLEDGKLINTERSVNFSIGRRSCAGEALARPEVYIFFTSWILRFHVTLPEGEKPDMDPAKGIGVRQPKPYKLKFIPRPHQKFQ